MASPHVRTGDGQGAQDRDAPGERRGVGSVLGRCRWGAGAHRAGRTSTDSGECAPGKPWSVEDRRARETRGAGSGERDLGRVRIGAAVDAACARHSVLCRAMRASSHCRNAATLHGEGSRRCMRANGRRDAIDCVGRRCVMRAVRACRSADQRRRCGEQCDQQEDDARHPASISHRRDRCIPGEERS